MDNKDKFWLVAVVNGIIEMVQDVDGKIIKFSSQKDAFQCAKEHALRYGEKYQCAVLEATQAEVGRMITERITYQSSTQPSSRDDAE